MQRSCLVGTFFLVLIACGGKVSEDRAHDTGGTGAVAGYDGGTALGGTGPSGTGGIGARTTTGGEAPSSGLPSGGVMTGGTPAIGGAAAGGTGGGGPAYCGPLISDLEDGSGRICTGDGRLGVWYAYNDTGGEQWPSPTTPGIPIIPSAIPGGRGNSFYAMHTYGSDFHYPWGAGIGFDLDFDGVTYRPYDASEYVGLSFWGKSDLGTTILVGIGTDKTTYTEYGGSCECPDYDWICDPFRATVKLGPEWSEYRLAFTEFEWGSSNLPDRSTLLNIQFHVADADLDSFDFWIDDVAFLGPSGLGCEGPVAFADPVLEEVVRNALGLGQQELHCEDTCLLGELVAPGRGIRSLDGAECLGALTYAGLYENEITDLAPLAGLTALSALGLDGNAISDIRPLAGLTRLSSLSLGNNDISDLTPLAALSSLKYLQLDDNDVADLSPVSQLRQLRSLDLTANRVSDLGPLVANGSDLSYITLTQNPIDCEEQATNIALLRARGVQLVGLDCP